MTSVIALVLLGTCLLRCTQQGGRLVSEKRALASDRRKIDTYFFQMEMYELNMRDQFKLRGILDPKGGLQRPRALKIYEARSAKDELWEQKQVLTLMLVRMERLAAGYYLEMFDEDIFFVTTGRHFIVTLRRLRFFIDAVQVDRPAAFGKFVVVANHMEAVTAAEEAGTTIGRLSRIGGVAGASSS